MAVLLYSAYQGWTLRLGVGVGELSVRPWRRYGHDRLYVVDSDDDQSIGYYDRKTGALLVEDEERRYEAVAALRPYLAGPRIPAVQAAAELPVRSGPGLEARPWESPSTPGGQPSPAEYDLAHNAPGAAAAAMAAELAPSGVLGLLTRLFRIENEATSWRVGARGEALVGRRLERLERRGWRVLHAIALPSGADIDHVVIGPAGVFTVNTKFHADARITVGTHVVWVNGFKQPYLRNSLHEAAGAQRRLSAALGFSVTVDPVLAFLGAQSIAMRDAPPDVIIASGETVDRTLRGFSSVLDAGVREQIYAAARREGTWLA
jgi:hypothetical protein